MKIFLLITLQKKKYLSLSAAWGRKALLPCPFLKIEKVPWPRKKMSSLSGFKASVSHSKCRFWEKKFGNLSLRSLLIVCFRWNLYRMPLFQELPMPWKIPGCTPVKVKRHFYGVELLTLSHVMPKLILGISILSLLKLKTALTPCNHFTTFFNTRNNPWLMR